MIFFGGVLGLVAIGVWIFCIIDAITTPADQVRTLPKLAWVAIVVFLVDLGSLAWLLAGRPWNARATTPPGVAPSRGSGGGFGMSATSSRRAPSRPLSPDDDDEFLASLAKRTPPKPADGPTDESGESGEGRDEGPQPTH